jgi:FK506-binding nuclear protein
MDTSMDVEGDEKLSKAQKKKAGKKLKAADGSAVPAAAETPSAASAPESKKEKKDKKDKKDKKADKTDKATASASTAEAAEPKKTIQKELPGGLKIADAKVGTGKIAKKGNTVSLRYIGKLMNGQIFDSNTKGKPVSGFLFMLHDERI